MTKRLTNNEFLTKLVKTWGTEIVPLEPYKKSCEKILVQHTVCGKFFRTTPNMLLGGSGCPYCRNRLNGRAFYNKVNQFKHGQIKILSDYTGCNNPIKFMCKKHSLIFFMSPRSFNESKFKCPRCKYEHIAKVQRKNSNDFKHELEKRHNGTIICLEEYKNTHTKIKFMCKTCGTVFCSEPNSVLRISGCPYCAESHGEQAIATFLKNKNIDFERQKTFDNCKNKRKLRYDFYIKSKNLLIEYDGLQHFKPIDYFGGKKAYNNQVKLDNLKNEFASKNGIKLIRIKFVKNEHELLVKLNSMFAESKARNLIPKDEIKR